MNNLGGKVTMTDYQSKAEDVHSRLPDDVDASVDELAESIQEISDYGVPVDEAARTVQRNIQDDYDGDGDFSSGSSAQDQDVSLSELTVEHDEEWLNVRGTIQELFDLTDAQDSWMSQRGIIGDDTGTTIFTVPERAVEENADLEFEEGDTVELTGVVGDAYQGSIGIKVVKTTTVEELEESYTPPENEMEFVGCVISLQSNSGLIKRCSEEDCSRVVSNTDDNDYRCPDHDVIENPEDDMRLKLVIDDGIESHQVYFDKEKTEAITGMTMDEAKELATDAMDIEAPAREMHPQLIGRHFRIAGDKARQYIIADKVEQVSRDWNVEGQGMIDTLTALEQEVES